MENLTPREIVEELDRYIIGQEEAKKAVAIAMRNRYRRKLLSRDLQEEIVPKNILLIGPTGVGKTEIARRLARLSPAPFLKIEVSKFTEVGYVGRDVESMIRDLMEISIRNLRSERLIEVEDKARLLVEERLLEYMMPSRKRTKNPLNALLGGFGETKEEDDKEINERIQERRERLQERLRKGELEEHTIEIEVEINQSPMIEIFSGAGVEELGFNFQDIFGGMFPKKRKRKKVTIAQAREILEQEEAQKLIDIDELAEEARSRVEEMGIIFLDEIDKVAGRETGHGPDVSREGVQRDILPIVEGSTVMTKYGPIKTDHILFIAAGAFHVSKPADLIPELQGRFPIRVEMKSLTEDDFRQILTEPENALTKQYLALLSTEDIEIEFTDGGIREIANVACIINEQMENIGARRLHTVMEKLLEDISFRGSELAGEKITIDKAFVAEKLGEILQDKDLSRYIL